MLLVFTPTTEKTIAKMKERTIGSGHKNQILFNSKRLQKDY